MQTSDQTEPAPKSPSVKSYAGMVISVLLGIWGAFIGISFLYFAFIFIGSRMINVTTLLIMTLIAASSALIIYTAVRFNKQKWYLSLGLVVLVWGVNSLFLSSLINRSSERLRMESISMQPTLAPGDYFFVDKLAYAAKAPQRGDTVTFAYPYSGETWIKRVIGLPGETVIINSGQVYINGVLLDEPDTIPMATRSGQWQVGESEFFVMGDNRANSSDSRQWGNVPLENVFGKVTYIYYPFSRVGKISNEGYAP